MGMTWVVTGCGGQLGSALVALLEGEGESVQALSHAELDVAESAAVRSLLSTPAPGPKIVVNAAAFTHVDRCEREPEAAGRGNAQAPAVLAAACREAGARLVHLSTDYVFPGDADRPYRETDPTGPRTVYGQTKLAGEEAVRNASEDFLVVRTSWVFGRGRNFIASILAQAELRRRGEVQGPLRVVSDQRGRPTYAADLARGIRRLVEVGARGLYHVANAGEATWWDLARASLDEAGYRGLEVERIRTRDLAAGAPRPAWSVLDCSKAEEAGVRMRHWREAVAAYLGSGDSPISSAHQKRISND
jgi:dTDP-4-dehydrorhamnose reductase